MKVSTSELQRLFNTICDHLVSAGVKEIEIDKDYYWDIDKEILYNPNNKPNNLELGQLSFDVETLKNVLEGKQAPIGWHFVPLSAVLRYIGEKYMA